MCACVCVRKIVACALCLIFEVVSEDEQEFDVELRFYGEALTWKGYLLDCVNQAPEQVLERSEGLEGLMCAHAVLKDSKYLGHLKELSELQETLVTKLTTLSARRLADATAKLNAALEATNWKSLLPVDANIPLARVSQAAVVILKGAPAQSLAESFKALKQDRLLLLHCCVLLLVVLKREFL